MNDIIFKLVKFGFVGFSGLIIDFGLTFLCKEKARINKYLANAIGFSVAATSNFFLNKVWTFEDKSTAVLDQYFLFIGIALAGLAINQLVLYLLHHNLRTNFYLAKLSATIVVVFWNFTLNYLITFK